MDYLINLIDLGIGVVITAFILFIIQTFQTVMIYRKIIKMYNNTITMQDLWIKTI
jgi:large-conductance mechanosensitive channel